MAKSVSRKKRPKKAAKRARRAAAPAEAATAAATRIHAIPLLESAESVRETDEEREDIHDCLVDAFAAVDVKIESEEDRVDWGPFGEQDCRDVAEVLFRCLVDKDYSPIPFGPIFLRLREKQVVLTVKALLDWLVKVVD